MGGHGDARGEYPAIRRKDYVNPNVDEIGDVIPCLVVDSSGMDERARVLVTVREGKFRLLPE